MKSRLAAMETVNQRRRGRIYWVFALVVMGLATAAFAQESADPPARVAFVSQRQGSVVFAPQGEEDWVDLPANRPLTVGDRLWSDRGARAELQLGAATLHVDGESHLGVIDLDERAARFVLQQGSANLRVRELAPGENVEVDTPNLAFRALQPGDYRIDVDPRGGHTRVIVQSGLGTVFGEGGESLNIGAGQLAHFAGRSLAQVQGAPFARDDFGLWAAERNRQEDQSVSARHVPRGVVGHAQLDAHGSWSQDPGLGAVWYPSVTVQDWAPYRYGHWSWIQPWGWTWVDDAPWGFAPFHYGRWTMIGNRWAWVPGQLVARPVYSPALVVFLGGASIGVGSGPGVGWYPLAPGEAWWPVYRTSPRYLSFANFNIDLNARPRGWNNHYWRQRPHALTAVREDDFRHGRHVHRHWQAVAGQPFGGGRLGVVPARPEGWRQDRQRAPHLAGTPPALGQSTPMWRFREGHREQAPAVREQYRAQREQDRLQRDAERAAREQQRAAEAAARPQQPQQPQQPLDARPDGRGQRGWFSRMQQDGVRQQPDGIGRQQADGIGRPQQDPAVREAQREAWRQQREQQRDQQRQQQDAAPRDAQRDAWRQQRELQREQPRQQHQQQQAQQPGLFRGVNPPAQVVPPQQVRPVQQAQPQQPQQAQPIGQEPGRSRWNRGERGQERREERGQVQGPQGQNAERGGFGQGQGQGQGQGGRWQRN